MRKHLFLILAAGLVLCGFAVQADAAKPLAVLSMADYNSLVVETSALNDLLEADQIPACLQGMLQLYVEGQNLFSLDSSRPWGAVLQSDGDDLSVYCFVPVSDAKGLWEEISAAVEEPVDVGNGVYRVNSSQDDRRIFVKVTKGWIVAADDAGALADVPDDPGKMIEGLNKDYDFALRLKTGNVPSYQSQMALDALKTQLNDQFNIESLVPEGTLDAVYFALENLQEVTLGWSKHK